jgi:hypothetical protein
MFVALFGIEIERDIFTFLIEWDVGCVSQALWQGWLAIKLVRKLPRREHGLGMSAGSLAKSGIECERPGAGLRSRLVRQVQKHMFRLRIVVRKRNVRGWVGDGL